ncbi:MAG: 16S rRNA (guanine(966)-N(2))-methyltransferase RsmD [Desulfobacterales bacterium]
MSVKENIHLRIIGGSLRGKNLASLSGYEIRPTADRLRESIFSIIAARVPNAVVLDLFAGTGAFGIEALSRHARAAVFIDNSRAAVTVIYQNLEMCRFLDRARVILSDITRGLGRIPMPQPRFDLVFMDPPYDRGFVCKGLNLLRRNPILAPGHCLILEHSSREPLPLDLKGFLLHDQRRYGKTLVSFLECVL